MKYFLNGNAGGLTCSRSSLTMQLTSGGSVCTPVFEPEEDILSKQCDSRTILINAANYCYHLAIKIHRLTRYRFQTNASFLTLMFRTCSNTFKVCGIFHNDFIANLPLTLQLKEFWKSVNIWQSYRISIVGCFFDSQCMWCYLLHSWIG